MQLNPQSSEFDKAIVSIAKDLFNQTPQIRKCHSEVNYCAVLSFEGTTTDRVIKLANHNRWAIEVEKYLYPPMRASGLPMPEIEFTDEDYSEPSEPFIVMPKFSDYTLADLGDNSDQASLQACEASGRFILDLHDRFAKAFIPFLTVDNLRGQLEAIQERLDQEQDLNPIEEKDPDLARIIERHLATFSKPRLKRLTHGQPHTLNILAGLSGEICAVDLGETIGMSSPLRDLALLLISHDGWSEGTGNRAQREAFLNGYGELDQEDIQELYFWEFSFWVKVLRSHMRMAPHPTDDQELSERIQSMVEKIRSIADGQSLLSPYM